MNATTWLCGSPPRNGQFQRYPGRFLFNLKKTYPEMINPKCLHLFSGSCDWGVAVDIRPQSNAAVVANYSDLPFASDSMNCGIADPPYADHWQGQWHGDLPKPKWILRELSRIVKVGGLIGILHIIVIPAYKELGVSRVALHPVLCGPNNAIRVFNVFRKTGLGGPPF